MSMTTTAAATSAFRLAPAAAPVPLPAPRRPVVVRPGTVDDLPFVDALQKRHAAAVGWMPRQQLEGKVAAGQVLVAEGSAECSVLSAEGGPAGRAATDDRALPQHSAPSTQHFPLGYLIAADRYFKRDDVGIVYQVNVAPGHQRGLVGAALLKAQFERSAYGCRLYCCWCAQDLAANRFWAAMGFVPLAFRTGGTTKGPRRPGGPAGRVHVFWQRRVRAGDATTPYWFPSQTSGGSIRADRLVLPIPAGADWGDPMPVLLPTTPAEPTQLPGPGGGGNGGGSGRRAGRGTKRQAASAAPAVAPPAAPPRPRVLSGWSFAPPPPVERAPASAPTSAPASVPPAVREPRRRVKNDPAHVAMARELRDRWLEQVNAAPPPASGGKYDVSRAADGGPGGASEALRSLPAVGGTLALPAPVAA